MAVGPEDQRTHHSITEQKLWNKKKKPNESVMYLILKVMDRSAGELPVVSNLYWKRCNHDTKLVLGQWVEHCGEHLSVVILTINNM